VSAQPPEAESLAPDAAHLEREAKATIESYRAFLASPAFQHSVDLMVLVKIAGDDSADLRERRRAAEVLAKLRLQAMEALADLTGTREQSLDRLGLKTGPQTLALTQVNQRIEIVRANDWRNAPPLDPGAESATPVDVDVEVLPPPARNGDALTGHAGTGHAGNGHTRQERDDAADPAA